MARPRKAGLDYFPFDCDFFNDEKIVAIAGEFGIKGEIVAIKLLCAVYRNGYFMEWNEMQRLKILRQTPGVSAELFDQILNRLVRWGFFDASLFDSVKVLTSVGIQRRYFEITKRCQRIEKLPHLLVNVTLTPVNVTLTPVNVTLTPQIKGTKTKEKKSPKGNKKKNGVIPGLDKDEKTAGQRTGSPKAPSLDEVIEYFRRNCQFHDDWELQAKLFFSHYDSLGWKNTYGTTVQRWDSKANNWIFKIEQEKKKNQNEQTRKDRGNNPGGGIPIKGRVTPGCGLKRPDKG